MIFNGEQFDHFETPSRLLNIKSEIKKNKNNKIIQPKEYCLENIVNIHDNLMVKFLSKTCSDHLKTKKENYSIFPDDFPAKKQGTRPKCFIGLKGYYCTDLSTSINKNTRQAIKASANTAIEGAYLIKNNTDKICYSLCRPLGHHAGKNFFGGYCYLNNAAIAADVLLNNKNKVAILDLDYHHGNGTQDIFYNNPNVWYGSIHADSHFECPYFAGYENEIGENEGIGTNVNIPVKLNCTEKEYFNKFKCLLDESLIKFSPDYLIISMGYDTYKKDPIGGLNLTTESYFKIGTLLSAISIPILIIQEGGYFIEDIGRNLISFSNGFN